MVGSGQGSGILLPKQQQQNMSQHAEPRRARSTGSESIITAMALSEGALRLTGHGMSTFLLSVHRDRQQNTHPCLFLVSRVICNSPFSFSIYLEFCCHFLFVPHTCDFLPSHHKFPPNKTICTAIATS